MKNKTTLFSSKIMLSIIVSVLSFNVGFAQEAGIFELVENDSEIQVAAQAKTSSLKKGVNSKSNISNNLSDFKELKYNLKPTIYLSDNRVKKVVGDSGPLRLKMEGNQINILKSQDPLFNSVELIVINIEKQSDLNMHFDVSSLQGFNNLKYIYVQCHFNCSPSQIEQFVRNATSEMTIFFMNVNPS